LWIELELRLSAAAAVASGWQRGPLPYSLCQFAASRVELDLGRDGLESSSIGKPLPLGPEFSAGEPLNRGLESSSAGEPLHLASQR
jgi:hypothetical protein